MGYGVTPFHDHNYFNSNYYREPGGVLFETATERSGFAIDEPLETPGESLKLPEWFESTPTAIESDLPSITLHPIEKAS